MYLAVLLAWGVAFAVSTLPFAVAGASTLAVFISTFYASYNATVIFRRGRAARAVHSVSCMARLLQRMQSCALAPALIAAISEQEPKRTHKLRQPTCHPWRPPRIHTP
jgi:hypothetical protein